MSAQINLSQIDDDIAAEKGRLLAAKEIAENPESRKRVESMLGVAYCKNRWPEAYSPSLFFKRLIDRLHFRTF